MGLETASYISQLVDTNPIHTDGLDQADAHLRLIKAVLQSQFPNFTAAALASSNKQIDGLCANSVGSMQMFPKQPTSFQNGGGAGTGAQWLEADGSVYNIADYPTLGAFYGSTFGGNGSTTFGLPALTDAARFPRSRLAGGATVDGVSYAAGVSHGHQIESHTHTASTSITDPGHGHGVTDPGHSHGTNVWQTSGGLQIMSGASPTTVNPANTASSATGISINGNTTGISASTTVSANTGMDATGETRPFDFCVFMCIKT